VLEGSLDFLGRFLFCLLLLLWLQLILVIFLSRLTFYKRNSTVEMGNIEQVFNFTVKLKILRDVL
jgi:hypothetical protein